MNEIKCILIDDELEALQRLGTLLSKLDNIKIVGIIQQPSEAAEQIKSKNPDIVFLDVEMPKMSGFDVVESIKSAGLTPTVVFVTGYNQYAIKAIKAAAFDYLIKPVDIDELKECIVRFGSVGGYKLSAIKSLDNYNLSPREKEILQLLVQGKSSKEISSELYISKTTVDTHRRNILSKTGLNNIKELISFFLAN